MTRAVFFTTASNDCGNHVAAWNAVAPVPAKHVRFDAQGVRNDWQFINIAMAETPDVMFYIGACEGLGNPQRETFRALRKIAPLVNLCSDSADAPWHIVLRHYHRGLCFDLQVGIDGPLEAPVDLAVMTPVDFRAFGGEAPERDIRCGFSGGYSGRGPRWAVIHNLVMTRHVTLRKRANDYADHVRFMRRCQMTINVSNTGTGEFHHLKGRTIEAGWAGSCLLESVGSPATHWFPKGSFIPFDDINEAFDIIEMATDELIAETAAALHNFVRRRCHPAVIYGEILDRLHVVDTLSRTPA